MKDMIYRADAIEAVQTYLDILINSRRHGDDFTFINVLTDIRNKISALPSAETHEIRTETHGVCLISKADAIEAVRSAKIVFDSPIDGFVKHDISDLVATVLTETFNNLPSAEAEQGWIPVEEQPPKFPCLVCDANGNQPSVPLGIVTITDEEHGEWHIDGRLWDSQKVFVDGEWGSQLGYGNRIIAWMPLPKPYKGGDNNEID